MPDLSLGFDTSAAHCAAALVLGDRLLAARAEEMSRGQAERLFPLLDELLSEAGVAWADLSVIGVGCGPGNFTGVRISVSAARGLALSLGIPAIGVGGPEAAAFGAPRPCRVILPARGDDVIWQDFGEVATEPALGIRKTLPPGPPILAQHFPMAEGIARIALARRDADAPRPSPIYLRPADAAPARDRGPVMLP